MWLYNNHAYDLVLEINNKWNCDFSSSVIKHWRGWIFINEEHKSFIPIKKETKKKKKMIVTSTNSQTMNFNGLFQHKNEKELGINSMC